MAPEGLSIQPAVEDDAPVLLRLIRGLADYERLSGEVVATEADIRKTLFGDKPAAESIIARLDGEPVGFALYFFRYSTFLARPGIYLEDLFVVPEMRGKGVGGALLAHLARRATQENCGRLEWSTLNWNESAISFYKNLGAKPLDEWTTFRLDGEALEALARKPI